MVRLGRRNRRQQRRDKTGQGGLRRRQRGRTGDHENISLGDVQQLYNDTASDIKVSASLSSFGDELGDFTVDDEFQKEVARKSQALFIGRQDAEIEVFLDKLTEKHGDTDSVLLYVVSKMTNESKIQVLINTLIHRGANTSATDDAGKTVLHHAVAKGFKGVVAKLLENDAFTNVKDKDDNLPFDIAKSNGNDDICALLLSYMPNSMVRNLFIGSGNRECQVSFHNLLRGELQQTVLTVLDCMIEPAGADGVKVYYNILEADESGRSPNDPLFNADEKSPLQIIAKMGEKNIVYHDAVRLLLRKKWKQYARARFQINSFMNIIALLALTFSAVVAAMKPDPTVYDTALQITRAVAEVLSFLVAILTLITELNQLRRHRIEYFHDLFNWMDFSSAILIICVLPLRYAHNYAQWHVFAFGYLFWCIRIFKFAAIFRHIGVYSQVLFRTLAHDIVQFIAVFLVILLAFSGSFILSLRGDEDLDTHDETSTFWGILFVGLRILIEAQPVVEYTGTDGYRVVSTIFMIGFLFTCLVILLNILIAQLSDTYQKVQQDAQRGLEVNRAWIVARVELNSFFFGKNYRRQYYQEWEAIPDLKHTLTKWDSPPINEMNKYVRDIWDSLDNHKMNLLTIRHRLARQENALCKMQDQLSFLVSNVTTQMNKTSQPNHASVKRPKFARSNSEFSRIEEEQAKEKIRRQMIGHLHGVVDTEDKDTNSNMLDTTDGNISSTSDDAS